jgi:hypothetical protein
MRNITQSQRELLEHLTDAIRFLTASAQSFDQGFDGEAKRMATTVRVLCHDTGQSVSLLGQLALKSMPFCDTGYTDQPGNLMTFCSLVSMRLGGAGSEFIAPLDNRPGPDHDSTFDGWWAAVVLDDKRGNRLSRRDVVLQLANKDGGAHVDPQLSANYAAISRTPGFGWTLNDPLGARPMPGRVERVTMRQITYEVIKTLDRNGYRA